MALGNESGFPKFPKIKYLGGDSVSCKAVHVWHFFQKRSIFENDLPDLDPLALTKNRDNLRVRTIASPISNGTGDSFLPGRSGTSTDVVDLLALCLA